MAAVIPGRADRREPGIHHPDLAAFTTIGSMDSGQPLRGFRNDEVIA